MSRTRKHKQDSRYLMNPQNPALLKHHPFLQPLLGHMEMRYDQLIEGLQSVVFVCKSKNIEQLNYRVKGYW